MKQDHGRCHGLVLPCVLAIFFVTAYACLSSPLGPPKQSEQSAPSPDGGTSKPPGSKPPGSTSPGSTPPGSTPPGSTPGSAKPGDGQPDSGLPRCEGLSAKLTIDDHQRASVSLRGAGEKPRQCKVLDQKDGIELDLETKVPMSWRWDATPAWLQALLTQMPADRQLQCVDSEHVDSNHRACRVPVNIEVPPPPKLIRLPDPAIASAKRTQPPCPSPASPRVVLFTHTPFETFFKEWLGTPTQCWDVKREGAKTQSKCSTIGDWTVELEASSLENVQAVQLDFYPSRTKIEFPVRTCTFSRADPLPLVPGASQIIDLVPSDPECHLAFRHKTAQLRRGDHFIMADVPPNGDPQGKVRLQIVVPDDLRPGTEDFELLTDLGTCLGTLPLTVTAPISIESDLEVHYAIPELEALHDRESKGGVAIAEPHPDPDAGAAQPMTEVAQQSPHVVNVAQVRGLDALPRQATGQEKRYAWFLRPRDGPRFVIPQCLCRTRQGRSSTGNETSTCELGDPSRIAFSMYEVRESPIIVDLVFRRCPALARESGQDGGAADAAGSDECALREKSWAGCSEDLVVIPLTVAKQVRPKSLPMPIANAVKVCCEKESEASDGETIAIGDDALQSGECWARIDFSKVPGHAPDYGPQVLRVTVTSLGSTNPAKADWYVKTPWPLDARSGGKDGGAGEAGEAGKIKCAGSKNSGACEGEDCIDLPAPERTSRNPDVYVVEVRNATQRGGAAYRSGIAPEIAAADITSPSLIFTARLRSRGPYGWRAPLRTYLTVPVSLVGVRFPASTHDLESSSESARYQFVKTRTGVLLVLEPWNYVTGKNRWPLAPGLRWGIEVYPGGDQWAVSHVLGLGMSIPLLSADESLFETTAAMSIFWEHDLRTRAGEQADYLLVTAGLNLFSFLGGH